MKGKLDKVKFRKVSTGMWADRKFRSLTRPQPNAQSLWQWLLTGPRTTQIPGIVIGRLDVLAAEIEWPAPAFQKAFEEASGKGMARADFTAGLVWLPRAPDHNKPESPNVIRSWRSTWDDVPECDLKIEVWHALKAFAKGWGKGWLEGFEEACMDPSPNQEQEQEQEQDRERGAHTRDSERRETPEVSPRPTGVIEAGTNLTRSLDEWRTVGGICQASFERWLGHLTTQHRLVLNPDQRQIHAEELVSQGDPAAQAEVVKFSIGRNAKSLIPLADVRARKNGMLRKVMTPDEAKKQRDDHDAVLLQRLKDGRAARGLADFRDPFPHERSPAYETQLRLEEQERRGRSRKREHAPDSADESIEV